MDTILNMEQPYAAIKELPPLKSKVSEAISTKLSDLKESVFTQMQRDRDEMRKELNKHEGLLNEFKDRQLKKFDEIERRTSEATDCALVESQERQMTNLQNEIYANIQKELKPMTREGRGGGKDGDGGDGSPSIPIRGVTAIWVEDLFKYSELIENEQDLDRYLENLRSKLKAILEDNSIRLT